MKVRLSWLKMYSRKSKRPEMKKLAQEILTSQEKEIDQMKQWRQSLVQEVIGSSNFILISFLYGRLIRECRFRTTPCRSVLSTPHP
jgi:hypothetical protein